MPFWYFFFRATQFVTRILSVMAASFAQHSFIATLLESVYLRVEILVTWDKADFAFNPAAANRSSFSG